MIRRSIALASLLLTTSCDVGTDPITDVTGTWTGTLSLVVAGTEELTPLTLVLVQSGKDVTGTLTVAGTTRSGDIIGTVSSNSMLLSVSPQQDPSDDCHLFSYELFFEGRGNTMNATDAGGVRCNGNGSGGHTGVSPFSAAMGTLTRS